MFKTKLITEGLQEGVTLAHHAISSRSSLPILTNFHLEARKGEVVIRATDLEIGIQVSVAASTEKEGDVVVPAKTFLDFVNSIGVEKIELEADDKRLELKGKGIKTSFPTQKADEFPALFEEKGLKMAELGKKELEKIFSRVVFAAAQDSTRPALSGVLIKSDNDGVNVVATDGYRLSLGRDKGSIKGAKQELDLLVSSRVIKEVLGVKNASEVVSLYSSDNNNQVIFDMGDVLVVGRLIEAEYPDYQKIIPDDYTTRVYFDRGQALSAVRSSSVIAREAANIVKMNIGKKEITFSATATSAGENEMEIDAKLEGEENEIAFNARYLSDLLSNIDKDEIVFEMTGPLSPGVFRLEKDKNFLHLIMPIRVQE